MKIKETIYFFMILVLIFLGAISKWILPLAMCLAIFLTIIIGLKVAKERNSQVPIGIVYLLTFQNFCIGMGAHLFGNTNESLKYLTQIPFITIFIIWITSQTKICKERYKSRRSFFILLVCIGISICIGRGSILSILMNIRNIITFYLVFEIGRYYLPNKESFDEFVKKFLFLARIVLVVGIIILILGFDGYKSIGIKEVYIAKGSPITSEQLDGRFHTTLIKKQYNRMGSLYYEPVNLAYFYAAAVLITIFYNWTNKKWSIVKNRILMIIGLILTFGKGGYIIVIAALLFYYGEYIWEGILAKFSKKIIKKITIVSIIILLVAFACLYYNKIGAAVKPHFWGVIQTWSNVKKKPIGYGVGTGGNASAMLNIKSSRSWLSSGGETAIMSFMYQLGVQGIIAFIICFLSTRCKTNTMRSNPFERIALYIPYILLCVSFLQDNTFTPQCITIFMLMQGAAQNLYVKTESEARKYDINSSTNL